MINPEDKKDVKNAMGKAIAKKVSKVTNDKKGWSKLDEKAHQSDVKANRSWNKHGRDGTKNPHL